MKVAYISPSVLPSRAANALHVVQQCEALSCLGADVTLYAKRSVPNEADLREALMQGYGVTFERVRLVSFFTKVGRGANLGIAGMALWQMRKETDPDVILSRNLYASFVLAVLLKTPLLFETHQLENGFRKLLQWLTMSRPWVTTICISEQLVECLTEHHGVPPCKSVVLHDAAPDGIDPLPISEKRETLRRITHLATDSWRAIAGYFGHLYAGRGLEILEGMAAARPEVLFLVFGGNDPDIEAKRSENRIANLIFVGHVPHPVARIAMTAMDVLLMPYQKNVSIGAKGHDTARWMSPMKMFEYMASGVPIISSDLPVLKEVLEHGRTCLLVPPGSPKDWISALDRILDDPGFGGCIGSKAREEYLNKYTWKIRAQRLIDAATNM